MGFPKLLLNIGLILAATTIFCIANSKVPYRLPNVILPMHYNVRLMTNLEEDIFYGEISVNFINFHQWPKIILHSQDLEIDNTATRLTDFNNTILRPIEHIYDNVTNMLTLNFDDTLLHGHYTLDMKFAGNFSETGFLKNGFIKIPHADKRGNNALAVTFLEPNKARRVFPCWDEPYLKATFNISVLHQQKYRVLSNMPIREQYANEDGMVWTHFDTTPAMSPYLVGIVIFDYIHMTNADETVNMWCRTSLTSQASFAHDIAEIVAPLVAQYTNTSQKIPKMDHVMIPDYPVRGMENWGLIIYNESKILYNDNTDPSFYRKDVASLVVHELAHQWFGNLVTPKWWSHLWLSEGFAAFFQAYFLDKIYEEWRTMDFLVVQNLHESLALDSGLMVPLTLDLDHTFDYGDLFINEIYDKAPVILRMLHHSISDEIFRKGIITYIARHQFTSVIPDDLWSAMQSALNNQYYIPHEDFTVKQVMDSWIKQSNYPVLNVTRNYETGEVAITQKCFYTVNECANTTEWWIPITFATQSNPDFTKTVPNHWLGPEQTSSFEIYPTDWIIVNVQQTAYCRVYYDATNWQKIISYLNSDRYRDIHVLNRAQIIDDAFAFLLENEIHSSVFLDLTNYLSREIDYVAWYPMFRILKRISQYFSLPEREHFKTHMLQIFNELLRIIGYVENVQDDDMIKMLRLDAMKWACTLGDTECKRIAANKLNEHLMDPDNHKIPQWWQEWTFYFGLSTANRATWDKVLELYQRKPDKQFWKILSGAEDPNIIIHYLNILDSNTTLFRAEDHFIILKIILEKHARNEVVLDYILQNFDIIKPRSIDSVVIINNILWNIFSETQLDEVKNFSENHFHKDPDTLFKINDLIEKRKGSLKRAVDIYIKRFKTN